MKPVYSSILSAAVTMAVVMSWPVRAQPPATHALIHIKNESRARATLYYKWGNGRWKVRVIEMGRAAYFNWRYDGNSRSSPNFIVRLDVDTQGVKFVEHVLSRGASPDDNSPRYGHHYVIRQVPGTDTRYIDAVTIGAVVKITDKNTSRPNVT
jgi:hypothetical protein